MESRREMGKKNISLNNLKQLNKDICKIDLQDIKKLLHRNDEENRGKHRTRVMKRKHANRKYMKEQHL